MKSGILKFCCLAVIVLVSFTGMLMAQEESGFSASASVDYFSRFIWRGMNLNNDSVLQYNIEGGALGFTGGIWANMPLTDTGFQSAGKIDEVDFSLDYSRSITDKVGFSLGVIHYTFHGREEAPATTEIYGGINFDVPLSPSITWYRDVGEIDGSYIQFGFGHSFEKIGQWSDEEYVSLDLSGNFGLGGSAYNSGYFGYFICSGDTCNANPDVNKTRFNDFTLSIAVPFQLKHGISITPSFNVSAMLDGKIRDSVEKPTNVWFGLNFTKTF